VPTSNDDREVSQRHQIPAPRPNVERGTARLIFQGRAHRLADVRKRRVLTQRDVAQAMGVTARRVSQIENGELSGIDVLDRYLTA